MTNLFDQYVESILESTSFLDLPDTAPYGFWISPEGEFFTVAPQRHGIVAKEIISSSPRLIEKLGVPDFKCDAMDKLTSEKYIRVAKMSSKEYTADVFYYANDGKSTPIPFEPTNSAKRTLNDIAEFYNMRITYMKR
jgi:hypothetical protein